MDHDDEFDHKHFNEEGEHNVEEEEEDDDILINVPMDDFSGEIDLDDIQKRLSFNLQQYRKDRERKRGRYVRCHVVFRILSYNTICFFCDCNILLMHQISTVL